MVRFRKRLAFLVIACLFLTACGSADTPTGPSAGPEATPTQPAGPTESVDYAGSVPLDMDSSTAKVEVTVKTYVDGDIDAQIAQAFKNAIAECEYAV